MAKFVIHFDLTVWNLDMLERLHPIFKLKKYHRHGISYSSLQDCLNAS